MIAAAAVAVAADARSPASYQVSDICACDVPPVRNLFLNEIRVFFKLVDVAVRFRK